MATADRRRSGRRIRPLGGPADAAGASTLTLKTNQQGEVLPGDIVYVYPTITVAGVHCAFPTTRIQGADASNNSTTADVIDLARPKLEPNAR